MSFRVFALFSNIPRKVEIAHEFFIVIRAAKRLVLLRENERFSRLKVGPILCTRC